MDAWHQEKGARWDDFGDLSLVAGYGEVAPEVRALHEGCGLIENRWTGVITLTGEDRQRFLNGYLTCDVGELESGSTAFGFVTNAQGRILADAIVTASDEAMSLEVPATRAEGLVEHLGKYVIADRVEISIERERTLLQVVGPAAAGCVFAEGGDAIPALQAAAPAMVQGIQVDVLSGRSLQVPVFRLAVPSAKAGRVASTLVTRGARPVGFEALETLRIEAGVPRYGADFDDAHFPQETGLEDGISYTKGCYLGQEVVARIHYRGHVNHVLRAVLVEGDATPAIGAIIEHDNQAVGKLGSLTFCEGLGRTIGLTIIHRNAAEIGQVVEIDGGHRGRIEQPGFAVAGDEI